MSREQDISYCIFLFHCLLCII